MQATSELQAELSDTLALSRQSNEANNGLLWRLAIVAGIVSVGAGVMYFALAKPLPMALLLANATALLALYLKNDAAWLARRAEALPAAFLLAQLALVLAPLWGFSPKVRVAIALLVFPTFALCFRLTRTLFSLLLGACWGAAVWLWVNYLEGLWAAPKGLGGVLWPTLATLAFLAAGLSLEAGRRRQFLADWRREATLGRERERIQGEIEEARRIQLSMLPRSTPQLPGLDLASVSLPASEVGGDYYDFFEVDLSAAGEQKNRSLGVVIGDVAGHGLASGLLLSAIRSCLFLLRRQLHQPATVLAELDGMVRHTSDRRLLVTLLCAFIDPAAKRLRVASAGHPPVLHAAAATGVVQEVAAPALPLGTRLHGKFHEVEVELAPGDVVAFYTDGLTETVSGNGDFYGQERFSRLLSDCARSQQPAREIRNTVLSDLSTFKGDARRGDDVTLVVVRVG